MRIRVALYAQDFLQFLNKFHFLCMNNVLDYIFLDLLVIHAYKMQMVYDLVLLDLVVSLYNYHEDSLQPFSQGLVDSMCYQMMMMNTDLMDNLYLVSHCFEQNLLTN